MQALLQDENRPILVAVDDTDMVLGYCFCIYQKLTAKTVTIFSCLFHTNSRWYILVDTQESKAN